MSLVAIQARRLDGIFFLKKKKKIFSLGNKFYSNIPTSAALETKRTVSSITGFLA